MIASVIADRGARDVAIVGPRAGTVAAIVRERVFGANVRAILNPESLRHLDLDVVFILPDETRELAELAVQTRRGIVIA